VSTRVLITGGCGFIGSHLAERLLDEGGYEIVLFDNMFRAGPEDLPASVRENEHTEVVRGDVRNTGVLREVMDGCDYVYHLAAVCLNRSLQFPGESLTVNLTGANNVFQLAAELGIKKVLFASSASVYGDQDTPMQETDLPAPQSPYGTAKLAGEHLLSYYRDHDDLDYTAFRFFNVYGPRQSTDAYYTSVINVFVNRLLNGQSPEIHGTGEQKMDFIHVRDIARGLTLGMESDFNGVVNLGSGSMTSIADLAETLIDIAGVDEEPEYIPRDVIVSERKAATERAKTELGFETQIGHREGLGEVLDWLAG
jgi:UDP-glucose 4-epimerase